MLPDHVLGAHRVEAGAAQQGGHARGREVLAVARGVPVHPRRPGRAAPAATPRWARRAAPARRAPASRARARARPAGRPGARPRATGPRRPGPRPRARRSSARRTAPPAWRAEESMPCGVEAAPAQLGHQAAAARAGVQHARAGAQAGARAARARAGRRWPAGAPRATAGRADAGRVDALLVGLGARRRAGGHGRAAGVAAEQVEAAGVRGLAGRDGDPGRQFGAAGGAGSHAAGVYERVARSRRYWRPTPYMKRGLV